MDQVAELLTEIRDLLKHQVAEQRAQVAAQREQVAAQREQAANQTRRAEVLHQQLMDGFRRLEQALSGRG